MVPLIPSRYIRQRRGHKGRDPELIGAQVECLFLAHKLIFVAPNRRTVWLGLEHYYCPTSPFNAGANRSHLGANPRAWPAFPPEPRRIAHHHRRDWRREQAASRAAVRLAGSRTGSADLEAVQ